MKGAYVRRLHPTQLDPGLRRTPVVVGTRSRAESLGAGGIGEELDDEPRWVVTDARNDFADDAGVAGDADVVADFGLIVVEVSGGDDLVAAT